MKLKRELIRILALATLGAGAATLVVTGIVGIGEANPNLQKSQSPASDAYLYSTRLDSGIAPLVGKRVFYQLTDAEGGVDAVGGRKRPAFLIQWRRFGEVDLAVFTHDGVLVKERVSHDSSRRPGSWDNISPFDLRGH